MREKEGTIKTKGILQASPIVTTVYRHVSTVGTMYIQCMTRGHADAGELSKFHCKHSGKRVTRAGLSSNRIKAIVRVGRAQTKNKRN